MDRVFETPPTAHAASRPALVTRFAPSPTGYLHLGHVVNAVYVWGAGRALGARILLRLEDHDRVRCRPDYERALLEDLDWLGFEPDAGRAPVVRQSDRGPIYDAALARLRRAAHVYACDCSRRTVGGTRYTGHCRQRGLPEAGASLRVTFDAGEERADDLGLGALVQDPSAQCGDLLVRDRDGQWTYQFAVTVDDIDQGVDLVIRGLDLLDSTGRQLRLGRLLGRERPPVYLHHPLVHGPDGEKLSKARGDTGIRELRAAGWRPDEVIGLAATAVGLIGRPEPLPAASVPGLFDAWAAGLSTRLRTFWDRIEPPL
jgi:glutamyl-tRNA synthetase/glutamyl-Q tRNA(Asp) synthetase